MPCAVTWNALLNEKTDFQPITANTEFLPMEPHGINGVDAAYSRIINNNRLWVFGDTLFGAVQNGSRHQPTMFRNSIAVETPDGKISYYRGNPEQATPFTYPSADLSRGEYYWPLGDGVFVNPRDKEYYWPSDIIGLQNKAYIFLRRAITLEEGTPGFRFDITGNDIAVIHNPSETPQEWDIDIFPLNETSATLGVAANTANGYVYALENDPHQNHSLYLKRISVDNFIQGNFSTEYYCRKSSTWQQQKPSEPLIAPGAPEASLTYDNERNEWRMVYTPNGLGNEIVIRSAPAITGPWDNTATLKLSPHKNEDAQLHYYAAKEIPGDNPSEIRILTCTGSRLNDSLKDSSVYVPIVTSFQKKDLFPNKARQLDSPHTLTDIHAGGRSPVAPERKRA